MLKKLHCKILIKSVAEIQTLWRLLKMILIDDCSKTIRWRNYYRKCSTLISGFVIYDKKKNSGAAVEEYCLQEARGEWCSFYLDSDDSWGKRKARKTKFYLWKKK